MSNSTVTYAQLEELKMELGIPTTNDANDYSLELALEGVSRSIELYCGRRFHGGSSTAEVRYYTPVCQTELAYIDDILSISSLRTDADGDGIYETTHSTALYYLTPFNAALDDKPYTGLVLRPNATAAFPTGLRSVEITGHFGYAPTSAIPPVIKKACLIQAAMDFRAKDSPMGVAGGRDFSQSFQSGSPSIGLHPFVRRQLDQYRWLVVA